jgi:hypothetical protein
MTVEQRDDTERAAVARAVVRTLREAAEVIGARCTGDARAARLLLALDRLVLLFARLQEKTQ